MSILPPEGSSLGNPLQYSPMYYENEIKPLQKLLLGVNRIMPNDKRITLKSLIENTLHELENFRVAD